jgi:hypothetical protein
LGRDVTAMQRPGNRQSGLSGGSQSVNRQILSRPLNRQSQSVIHQVQSPVGNRFDPNPQSAIDMRIANK